MASFRKTAKIKTVEDVLWLTGTAGLIGAAVVWSLWAAGVLPLERLARPCLLHALTGLYCPGCGGTRAVKAFLHGRIAESLFYHPAVPFMLTVFAVFMVSQTVSHISGGRVRGLRYRSWYAYVTLALIALSLIVKNAAALAGAALW